MYPARRHSRASCDEASFAGAALWDSRQRLVQQLVTGPRRIALALIERARPRIGGAELQLQPDAAAAHQPRLGGGEQLRARPARAGLRQYEELIDLAHET